MKKKMKILQISGLRGLLISLFVVSCLIAGFVAFPAIVAMHLWNYAAEYIAIPAINIYQGILLWAIFAISGYILNSQKKCFVVLKAQNQLTEEEMKAVMNRIKMHRTKEMLAEKPVIKEEKVENEKEKV